MGKNILFLLPKVSIKSEVWMEYMMKTLGENLKVICTLDNAGSNLWNNTIPIIELEKLNSKNILRKIKYSVFHKTRNPFFVKDINLKLIEAIDKYKVDIIFVQFGDFALLFAETWKRSHAELFVHFHGYDAFWNIKNHLNPKKSIHHKTYKADIKGLSERATFFANSNFTCELLVSDFQIRKDRVVTKYYSIPVPKDKVIHYVKKEIVILHIGRLVDFKAPHLTIQAFEIAREKGLRAKLVVAGNGYLMEQCQQMKNKSKYKDSISLLGAVDSKTAKKLFLSADIFTQHNIKGERSNQEECLGVSILEAMSYCLPVVSCRSGAVVETVKDSETGFLVESTDVYAQANAFLALAESFTLRQQMGDFGRKRVQDKFSSENERKIFYTAFNIT